MLEDCELLWEPIHAITYCENCGKTYDTVPQGKICPHCGSSETYLLRGQEVMIKQIETPDEGPADANSGELAAPADTPDAVDAANPLRIA